MATSIVGIKRFVSLLVMTTSVAKLGSVDDLPVGSERQYVSAVQVVVPGPGFWCSKNVNRKGVPPTNVVETGPLPVF